jgi:hypothetical protein
MKREAWGHPKHKLVGRDLKLKEWQVYGLIGSLLAITGKHFPQGGVGRWSNEEIAAAIDYHDDPDELIAVLIKRKILDAVPWECRLYVHDWHEHADTSVHAVLCKKILLFENGVRPNIPHDKFNDGTRKRIAAAFDEAYGPAVEEAPEEQKPEPPEKPVETPESAEEEGNQVQEAGVGPGLVPDLSPNGPGHTSASASASAIGESPSQTLPLPESGKSPDSPGPPGPRTAVVCKGPPVPIPQRLCLAGFEAAWAAWHERLYELHRIVWGQKQCLEQLHWLATIPSDPVEVLRYSARQGYKGLVDPNAKPGKAKESIAAKVRRLR